MRIADCEFGALRKVRGVILAERTFTGSTEHKDPYCSGYGSKSAIRNPQFQSLLDVVEVAFHRALIGAGNLVLVEGALGVALRGGGGFL